jgi:hypothetical protein
MFFAERPRREAQNTKERRMILASATLADTLLRESLHVKSSAANVDKSIQKERLHGSSLAFCEDADEFPDVRSDRFALQRAEAQAHGERRKTFFREFHYRTAHLFRVGIDRLIRANGGAFLRRSDLSSADAKRERK